MRQRPRLGRVPAAVLLLACGGCVTPCSPLLPPASDGGARRDATRPCDYCQPMEVDLLRYPRPTCRLSDETGCGCWGPFRRCRCGCAEEEADVRCVEDLDVCMHYSQNPPRWHGRIEEPVPEAAYCADGTRVSDGGTLRFSPCPADRVCAMGGGPDAGPEGLCVPLSYCRAVARAGPEDEPPAVRCAYDDGTEVRDGPPEAPSCPEGPHRYPMLQPCGGVCGPIDCGSEALAWCLGLSERRSYGLCGGFLQYCSQSRPELNQTTLEYCGDASEEPCVCLVPRPQPGRPFEVGYAYPASLCRAYRDAFPDSVVCVDAMWRPVP